ncbi:DUF3012 domain-containing protein [Thalassotalea sp. PS06]|uniref:DUF3012 domain-containing protein n=1 Tax=Thalassotalea sp. PS06 TaxID=2594005 RepID=UPI0011642F1E|nr:DUF3012 domain-containing protein [Thalassotalea sp. PS06]QDP01958.1 DUF3012 domain-containing protein [Thalassotalea sp. PS06]
MKQLIIIAVAFFCLTGFMTEEENEKERERIWCENVQENPEVFEKEAKSMEYKVKCEIGKEKFCADLKAKSKGDWSSREAAAYGEYCVF